MKHFTHNATDLLVDKVDSLRHRHDSWRCLQLKLSGMRHTNHMLRTHFVEHGISKLLADNEGYVYHCEDGDIMILFQGRAQGILNKLASHFADIDSKRLFTLYDLHKDWAFFFATCYRKSLQKDEDWYHGNISDSMEPHTTPLS